MHQSLSGIIVFNWLILVSLDIFNHVADGDSGDEVSDLAVKGSYVNVSALSAEFTHCIENMQLQVYRQIL